MKNILTLTVLFAFLLAGVVQARTWTDSRGKKLIGDFVGFSQNDDTKIKIKTTTGRILFVPIKGLSQEDQDYVQSLKENNNAQRNTSGFQNDSPAPAPRNNNNGSPVELQPVDNSNPNNEVVIVEGIGDTMSDAKKDAMRNAVEQVVGALVDAQTRVENDELIEQILTASGAYIEKSEVLSAKKENGLVTIKLRATVVKMSLTKKLKHGGGDKFQQVPLNKSVIENDLIVIGETEDQILTEVKKIKEESDKILDNIPYYEKRSKQSEEILRKHNPIYDKELKRDEEISSLKDQMAAMRESLANIEKLLNK